MYNASLHPSKQPYNCLTRRQLHYYTEHPTHQSHDVTALDRKHYEMHANSNNKAACYTAAKGNVMAVLSQ